MKARKVIYAGLAVMLLTNASLVSFPTYAASVVESTSSANSDNSSNASQSSSLTSESSGIEQSNIGSKKNNNQESITSQQTAPEKAATTAENSSIIASNQSTRLDAPTSADGVKDPSGNGFWLTIWLIVTTYKTALATGFTQQPQAEQYVTQKNSVKFHMETSSFGNNAVDDQKMKGTMWKQNNGKWEKTALANTQQTAGDGHTILVGSGYLHEYDISMSLPVGVYYFQFRSDMTNPGFNNGVGSYYSKLVKVTVVENPINADSITATADDQVVFGNVGYPMKATTDPTDATGTVSWQHSNNLSNQAQYKFSPANGRSTDFIPYATSTKTDSKEINTDVNNPGLPETVWANVKNDSAADGGDGKMHTSTDDGKQPITVYIGGLKAKEKSIDSGFSWEVDGVNRLQELSGASSWKYEWHYISNDGLVFDNMQDHAISDKDGVKHYSGTISSIADLNKADNILTFNRDSALMKSAAKPNKNKKYSFYIKMTPGTYNEKGELTYNDQTSTTSNLAQLTVTNATGFLSLDQVPNFSFGNVEANMLYNGVDIASSKIQTSDTLQVTDTRATPGWKLSATMTKMSAVNNDTLNDTTINLSGLPDAQVTNLVDNNKATDIASSTATGSWPVTGKLGLKANPNLNLTKDENFKSDITWTLTSTAPVTKALK